MKNILRNIVKVLPAGLIIAGISLSGCEELRFGDSFLDQQPEQIGVNMDTIFSKKYYAMLHCHILFLWEVVQNWEVICLMLSQI